MTFYKLNSVAMLLVLALSGCGVTAPKHNAGFADLDSLSYWDVDTTMSFSIGPTLLGIATKFMDDDPETQALLRGLDGVRVKAYEIEGDPVKVAEDLNRMSSDLRHENWEPVVLVREASETTHVLVKMTGDKIAGITVLTSDSVEVVLVNVMGDLQPELFSQAMAALDVPAPDVAIEQIASNDD